MKRTNPNEVFPAKYADKEEDRRDEPGQDDHHNHLDNGEYDDEDDDRDNDDGEEDDGDDSDLMSCAPRSIPGGQLHGAKPVKKEILSLSQFSWGECVGEG